MISQRAALGRFIRLARPDRLAFTASILFLAASSAFEGLSVGLVIPVLDILIKGGDVSQIVHLPYMDRLMALLPSTRFRYFFLALLGAILVCVVLKNVFVYVSELLVSKLSRACEHALRTKIYARYLSFGKKYFDQRKIGGLADLALNQVFNSCAFFRDLHNLVLYAFLSAMYLVIMLVISWKLTLISLAILPLVYGIVRTISRSIMRSTHEKFEIDQAISAKLFDTLSNMQLVRSYTSEAREAADYERLSERSRKNFYSIWKKLLLAPYLQEIILNVVIAGIVTVCFLVFLRSKMIPIAMFLSFFIMLRRFAGNLSLAGATYTDFCKTFVPIRELTAVFDDEDKEFIVGGTVPFTGLAREIEFRGVEFAYQRTPILKDLTLRFEKGKMTALVGPTGAGKTTIASLVPRFYDPGSGAILVDGTPIERFDLRSLRRRIALVDQDVAIFNATLRENILYGLEEPVPQEKLDEAAKKAYIYELIQSLPQGYDTLVGDRGVRLSGGEKQRVAIARALLKDPDIFIFDEATSSLDVETERQIQKAVENVTRGRTVVAIAHRLSTIKNADRIYVIDGGRVVETGTFNELVRRTGGKFYTYWHMHWTDADA